MRLISSSESWKYVVVLIFKINAWTSKYRIHKHKVDLPSKYTGVWDKSAVAWSNLK